MKQQTVNRLVLLLMVIFISAVFLSMIRFFLMAILLAGIFSAFLHPVYRRLAVIFGERRRLASLTTLVLVVGGGLIPLAGLLTIVTAQAIKVAQSATPWVQHWISQPSDLSKYFESIPYYQEMLPYREPILRKIGEMVGWISGFLLDSLSSATVGTVNFFFLTLILLYTMYFFLIEGDLLLRKILYYLPLQNADERRILARFTSVTRATLKGTAVIGILQGSAAGLALAIAGIPSAVFWGTIMTFLSVIPGIGSALVWFPAAVYLLITGKILKGIFLIVFCGVVVGSADNLLRPRLVGKDTQMHELMILFSTLGGLAYFGIIGFILGPIVAALFITLWEIYGTVFKDILPEVGEVVAESDTE